MWSFEDYQIEEYLDNGTLTREFLDGSVLNSIKREDLRRWIQSDFDTINAMVKQFESEIWLGTNLKEFLQSKSSEFSRQYQDEIRTSSQAGLGVKMYLKVFDNFVKITIRANNRSPWHLTLTIAIDKNDSFRISQIYCSKSMACYLLKDIINTSYHKPLKTVYPVYEITRNII